MPHRCTKLLDQRSRLCGGSSGRVAELRFRADLSCYSHASRLTPEPLSDNQTTGGEPGPEDTMDDDLMWRLTFADYRHAHESGA